MMEKLGHEFLISQYPFSVTNLRPFTLYDDFCRAYWASSRDKGHLLLQVTFVLFSNFVSGMMADQNQSSFHG